MKQRVATGLRLVGVVALAAAASVLGLGPASAAPQTVPVTRSLASSSVPAPVRQLLAAAHAPVAKHASTAARHALAVPGEDDEQPFTGFNPGCAAGQGKAKPNGYVYSETKLKLDWVLTGTGLRKTGSVKTKAERAVSLKLPSVRSGDYRVTLAVHGQTDLVADQTFDVLPCVVVEASCRAVTFTNPSGDPTAYVTYSGHKKNQEFDLELAPGASRTVRADYSKIDYDASSDDPDASISSLGHATVKVKQKCAHDPAQPVDNAVQTTGVSTCVASVNGVLTLGWSAQPSLTGLRYEVLNAQRDVVQSGSFKGGKDKDLSLSAGTYTYRSYANGNLTPFEDVTFDILACVEVTPRCRAIQVDNLSATPLVVIAYTTDDETTEVDDDGEENSLPASGAVTIPWTGSTAWVLAVSEGGWSGSSSGFLSLASSLTDDGELETVTVPQNC
ncbi:MAG: hypothetical protein ACRYG2_21805 [Janthinobacterium lividum]